MTALTFIILASFGAGIRGLATIHWPRGHRATFLLNLTGAFLLGILTGSGASTVAISAGGLGAMTTFSTFAADTIQIRNHSGLRFAAIHVFGTLVLGLSVAWMGLEITD